MHGDLIDEPFLFVLKIRTQRINLTKKCLHEYKLEILVSSNFNENISDVSKMFNVLVMDKRATSKIY